MLVSVFFPCAYLGYLIQMGRKIHNHLSKRPLAKDRGTEGVGLTSRVYGALGASSQLQLPVELVDQRRKEGTFSCVALSRHMWNVCIQVALSVKCRA